MARWQRKQRRTDTKRQLEPPPPTDGPLWPAEQRRSSEPSATRSEPQVVVRKADVVVCLAYSPTQAAQALGVSRSSLYRFLPYLETIETPTGHPLIPVDELERLAAERRLDHRRDRAGPWWPGCHLRVDERDHDDRSRRHGDARPAREPLRRQPDRGDEARRS